MQSIAEQFPRRAFVTNGHEDWRTVVEGRVLVTTPKFGGRVKVKRWTEDEGRWIPASTLRVVAEDERVLDCDGSCGGTGVFRGGGMILNGKHVGGTSGPCYRCSGNGKQTPKDRGRNRYYDNHVRRFAV